MISKKPQYIPPDERDFEIFEATVPANHYLRQVNAIIDFERCREELLSCYAPTMGRPALEPVLLLKTGVSSISLRSFGS